MDEIGLPRMPLKKLEVRAGIEPAYADLQSDASPLCHRTPAGDSGVEKTGRNAPVSGPTVLIAGLSEIIQIDPDFALPLSQKCPTGR